MKKRILIVLFAMVVVVSAAFIAACAAVKDITLDRTEATIFVGDTIILNATVEAPDDEDKTVEWTSSDDKIAIVKNGIVKGISVGEATVTAKTVRGNKTATCKITVVDGDIYDRLTAYSSAQHNFAKVSVTSTNGDKSLVNNYSVTKTDGGYKVEYREENFSVFNKDANGNYTATGDEYKKVKSGVTEYSLDGTIVSGEEIGLKKVDLSQFKFAESNFTDVTQSDGVFTAKIADANAFCGMTDVTGATVTVAYSLGDITSLQIAYTSGETAVVILYEI